MSVGSMAVTFGSGEAELPLDSVILQIIGLQPQPRVTLRSLLPKALCVVAAARGGRRSGSQPWHVTLPEAFQGLLGGKCFTLPQKQGTSLF